MKAGTKVEHSSPEMSHAVREEILLSLVWNSMDAIVSADGVIDHWNPAAERLYGYTAEEAIGRPATFFVPSDKLEEFEQMKNRLERGERIERLVTQRLRKDGSRVEVEITVFAVMDSEGRLAATSVISHDMTENRELQKKVEETALLKTDFLAKMSHEIRTPLSAIIGTAELQMLTEMTPEQRRRMGIIEASGKLLLTIVDDILDFSKLSAGRLVLEAVDFNLVSLVQGIVDALGGIARSKELELAFYVDPGIKTGLRGDPNRVRQILNNLLSNALKFTSIGEVLLRVTKREETADDVALRFEVIDTGIGINPDVQKRLFQPFVQAEESISRRYGGTGLGLVISAQLVEQMRGAIQVDSELGKGSNFHFDLRFEKAKQIQPDRAVPTTEVFKGIHALVVSEGAVSRAVISQYLDSWGIKSLSIASAEEAVSELRSAREQSLNYAVVLLDEGRNNSGVRLAQIIKDDSVFTDTKIVIMGSGPRTSGSAHIVDSWLTKPVRPSLLFNSLQELFSKSDGDNGKFVDPSTVGIPRHAWRKDIRVLVVEDNLTNQVLIKEQLV